MNFRKLTCFFLLILFTCSLVFSQEKLLIGEWQDHLPYRQASWVTQSSDKVILSTGKALIYIDKEELSYEKFSKVDGLNDAEISIIKYDPSNKQLFVIYNSGVFDIINDEEIESVTSIKDNNSITGSKTINDFSIASPERAFFATSFGVAEFQLQKREFSSTTFTNAEVYAISSDGQFIYAAMEDGLYFIELNSRNKENFANWTLLSSNQNLPAIYKCSNTEFFNGTLYAVIDNVIYARSNGSNAFNKINFDVPSGFFVQWMSAEGNHLIIGLKDNSFNSRSVFIDKDGQIKSGGAACINRTLYGIEDEEGRIWYADEWRQIRYTTGPDEGCNKMEYDSPYSFEASQIEAENGKVYIASGGTTESYGLRFSRSGFYILNENGSWTNINEEFFPVIGQRGVLDYQTVALHPEAPNKLFIGSYYKGLTEFNTEDQSFKFYGEEGNAGFIPSALQSIIGAQGQVRITHSRFDVDNNLWLTNFGAPNPIVVLSADSIWYSFDTPSDNGLLTRVAIDQSGNKWFSTYGPSSSIIVFNENGTFDDPSDDKIRVINSSNSLLSRQVNCVEVDLNGSVWVGTSEGPVVFDLDPFDTDNEGSQIKVLEDSIAALLLVTEDILCIEIDGANRKWFGTRNGIFVQSPSGEIQEYRFTTENSPLLSNIVYDLDFDGSTGVMYISTALGIQSVKTNATSAKNTHSSNVYTYPNPVRPDYFGPVAIKGLARDADVRITDINGKLVYKTKAFGGQAIWDGNDYNGRRADTGTYLVFSASEQNPERKDAIVTKILMVK